MADSRTHLFANNAACRLAVGITDSDTTVTLPTGKGALFPDPGTDEIFLITVENFLLDVREIMIVTDNTADVLTVERGAEGTDALNFDADANTVVSNRVTAETLDWLASVGGGGGGGANTAAYGIISADGTLQASVGVESASRSGPGSYTIVLDPAVFDPDANLQLIPMVSSSAEAAAIAKFNGAASSPDFGRWRTDISVRDMATNDEVDSGFSFRIEQLAIEDAPIETAFSITVGVNSTGPVLFTGDGSGYYNSAITSVECGSIVDDPTTRGDATLFCCGWDSNDGGRFIIGFSGVPEPTFFATVTLATNSGDLVFNRADATYDNGSFFPDFTIWTWPSADEFSFVGDTISVVMV